MVDGSAPTADGERGHAEPDQRRDRDDDVRSAGPGRHRSEYRIVDRSSAWLLRVCGDHGVVAGVVVVGLVGGWRVCSATSCAIVGIGAAVIPGS